MTSVGTPPQQSPASSLAPVPAWIAAVAGVLGVFPVGVYVVILGGFSVGYADWRMAGLVVLPLVAVIAVVTGAALLLLGRSWSVLVGSVVTLGLVLYPLLEDASGIDAGSLVWMLGAPLLAAVLASLPRVRRWVAARRATRH